MSVVLGEGLTLAPPARAVRVEGQTSQKKLSAGSAHDWTLGIEGHASLTIRDTHWENGERDLRPMMPEPGSADIPLALALLHGKRRAGIYKVSHRQELSWMTVDTVRPGKDEWPSRTSPSLEGLHEICGKERVEAAIAQGIVSLGTKAELLGAEDNDRTKNGLRALFDPNRHVAPVALYAVTRVVPTLRHVHWL
ncbi:hypothetical protein [Nocardiopsis sp. ATB16-24]|uniref:hypothetical protein n=1 Tax=Nocardiopsis sp. ATB16-24 TaxID=3019555 RepID=UPI0025539455|nr:hypothetical protein [Nocardiopsis sp. ATB16-24]